MLIIDVGTNGEILLGNRQGVCSASSPTGPPSRAHRLSTGCLARRKGRSSVRIDPATLDVRYKIIGATTG